MSIIFNFIQIDTNKLILSLSANQICEARVLASCSRMPEGRLRTVGIKPAPFFWLSNTLTAKLSCQHPMGILSFEHLQPYSEVQFQAAVLCRKHGWEWYSMWKSLVYFSPQSYKPLPAPCDCYLVSRETSSNNKIIPLVKASLPASSPPQSTTELDGRNVGNASKPLFPTK